jgi:(p)ppGpp synthase/HD superfamily hydrolase
MDSVETAVQMALDAHEGQTDKSGGTYILHPLRLMQKVETREEKMVALLHDVVEDSERTFEDLEEEFSEEIISAVKSMTKKDGETYKEFIQRARQNDIAREVKKADIRDNLNVERLEELEDSDLQRIKKYHRSLNELKQID